MRDLYRLQQGFWGAPETGGREDSSREPVRRKNGGAWWTKRKGWTVGSGQGSQGQRLELTDLPVPRGVRGGGQGTLGGLQGQPQGNVLVPQGLPPPPPSRRAMRSLRTSFSGKVRRGRGWVDFQGWGGVQGRWGRAGTLWSYHCCPSPSPPSGRHEMEEQVLGEVPGDCARGDRERQPAPVSVRGAQRPGLLPRPGWAGGRDGTESPAWSCLGWAGGCPFCPLFP